MGQQRNNRVLLRQAARVRAAQLVEADDGGSFACKGPGCDRQLDAGPILAAEKTRLSASVLLGRANVERVVHFCSGCRTAHYLDGSTLRPLTDAERWTLEVAKPDLIRTHGVSVLTPRKVPDGPEDGGTTGATVPARELRGQRPPAPVPAG